jgi:hydrophobe/amphiphile efflux-1 (HAE1) family protein
MQKSFTDIFIKRPILSIVICLVLLILGIIGYLRLPLREFPKIDSSVVTITTTYPGANASLMANFITEPIESAVSGVEGIDYMTSSSSYSTSTITINARLGYNINTLVSDVNTQVNSVLWQLPKDINNPIIQKNDPNATPVYYLSFSSSTLPPVAIGNFLTNSIKPMIESVQGVGQAMVYGQNQYAMRVWLNPNLMAAQGITASDVANAINSNNVQSTAGQIKGALQQFDVNASTDLHTAKQFNNLVIRNKNGQLTRIQDIGHAELGASSDDFSAFLDGKPTVTLAILPKSTANPLDVAEGVGATIKQIKNTLPKDIQLPLIYNASQYISASIHEVYQTLIEAFVIVFLVVFLILGSWRSVIVPLVAIPLSIVSACALLLALNFSINTLTLLAFVLAIGLVVDDAIVVTENIHRHILMGQKPIEAAVNGAREIRFAIIAMTVTLAAAYLPIGFTTGLTGILFSEFAFTLACTVIISGIVALVLSPMMCSRTMTIKSCTGGFAGKMDIVFEKIGHYYRISLEFLIKFRWAVLVAALCIYACGILLFMSLQSQLTPPEDQGFVVGIVQAPASANLNYTADHSAEIARIYQQTPQVEHYFVINGFQGVNSAFTFAILKPWSERNISAFKLLYQWFPKFWSIPGVKAYPALPPVLPGASGYTPVEYVLTSNGSYDQLYNDSQKFIQAAKKWGGLTNVDSDLKIDKPEVNIVINRNLAGEMGIKMSDISQTLSLFLGKPITTRFSFDGDNYEVLPEVMREFRNNPEDIKYLYVRSQSGKLVPLDNLVKITESTVPSDLPHFNKLRSATISAGLAQGYTMGDAVKALNKIAAKELPKGINHSYSGQMRQFVDTSGKMAQVFIFAIIFIYLILAAQFESFIDPLVVMLSVPLSLTGALLLMWLTGATLNIYTEIGLVTLLGLMSKQAILIVEFANQLQERGKDFLTAILDASVQRFRPIVMTSLAMVLGALPLLFSTGPGAVSRFEMGLTIVAGLGLGTILTVFIIPSMYYILTPKREQFTDPVKEEEHQDKM